MLYFTRTNTNVTAHTCVHMTITTIPNPFTLHYNHSFFQTGVMAGASLALAAAGYTFASKFKQQKEQLSSLQQQLEISMAQQRKQFDANVSTSPLFSAKLTTPSNVTPKIAMLAVESIPTPDTAFKAYVTKSDPNSPLIN